MDCVISDQHGFKKSGMQNCPTRAKNFIFVFLYKGLALTAFLLFIEINNCWYWFLKRYMMDTTVRRAKVHLSY